MIRKTLTLTFRLTYFNSLESVRSRLRKPSKRHAINEERSSFTFTDNALKCNLKLTKSTRHWLVLNLPRFFFKMEDLCEEQDHLIVEFLESLECLQEKREYLNASVRGGHLHLSKARHSMGNKSLGALQYSHKMDCALYHVVVYLETFLQSSSKTLL